MSVNFDLPRLDGGSAEEQLAQLKSYVWQLVEKLNYTLNHLNDSDALLQTKSGVLPSEGDSKNATAPIDYVIATGSPSVGDATAYTRIWKSGMKEIYCYCRVEGEYGAGEKRRVTLPAGFEQWNLKSLTASWKGDGNGSAFYECTSSIACWIKSGRDVWTKYTPTLTDSPIYGYILIHGVFKT